MNALRHRVLAVPSFGASAAGEGVPVCVIDIRTTTPCQHHVREVIGVVLGSCRGILLLEAVAYRVEAVALGSLSDVVRASCLEEFSVSWLRFEESSPEEPEERDIDARDGTDFGLIWRNQFIDT